jgi:hypothetical protein
MIRRRLCEERGKPVHVKLGAAAAIGLTFSACAAQNAVVAPSTQPPSDLSLIRAENENAIALFVACIQRAAIKLDDGLSDPSSVARGILSACGSEFDRAVVVNWRNSAGGLETREKIVQAMRQSGTDLAIKFVLQNRAKRRSQGKAK